ncbi:hypothetical protein K3495_g4905, partial [Podosphaera aphanis]
FYIPQFAFHKKELPWPTWDGDTCPYADYRFKPKIKVEEDRQLYNWSRAICLGVLETVPESKAFKVKSWFRSGGASGDYDWREFPKEFDRKFLDPEATMGAAQLVTKRRQGPHEYFHDFIRDFEHQLAQCAENSYSSTGKLALLDSAINEKLRKGLVGTELSVNMGYEKYVSKVGMVVKQLEALSDYRPIGVKDTQTFYVMGQGTIDPVARSDNKPTSQLDADGIVKITGVNVFATKKPNKRHWNTSRKDYMNQPSTPQAP